MIIRKQVVGLIPVDIHWRIHIVNYKVEIAIIIHINANAHFCIEF